MNSWYDLKFFGSGAWSTVRERLDGLDGKYCPGDAALFRAFEETPYEQAKVAIICQDPYPNPSLADGLCLSIPNILASAISPTLKTVFMEYVNDLHLPFPTSTDLTPWAQQGVLLWNYYPTCAHWRSLSHAWPEWEQLAQEVVSALNERGTVFALVGAKARGLLPFITKRSQVFTVAHPSPRGTASIYNSDGNIRSSTQAFPGSRFFSGINILLANVGNDPIDWRLD